MTNDLYRLKAAIKNGLLPDIELIAMRDVTISCLTTPGAEQLWTMHKTVAPPNIVNYLDDDSVNVKGK